MMTNMLVLTKVNNQTCDDMIKALKNVLKTVPFCA